MQRTSLIRRLAPALVLAGLAAAPLPAFADGEVNLYTTREPGLVEPLLAAFSEATGIKVNTVFVKDGLPERIAAGQNSPPTS